MFVRLEQQRDAQLPDSTIAAETDEAKFTRASAPHAQESLPDGAAIALCLALSH